MSDTGQGNIPLAIVGMACRLPGAKNLDEFWKLIVSGGDATGPLPEEVLDRELYFDPRQGVRNKSYTDMGGLVPRLPFDNEKCRLPEEIIGDYDVAHLTLCEVASEALRDASYDPFDVPTRNAGVYFGHTGGSPKAGNIVYSGRIEETVRYLHQLESLKHLSQAEIEGIAQQIVDDVRQRSDHRVANPAFDPSPHLGAELIARAFGLDGPCLVVDAACASSLQALAIGARALQLGEIDMAVAGGASCCKSDSLVLFSQAYSVSAGKSCPFDEKATGLVTAEGYLAIILKTLDRAVADGDHIRCVIRGIGMAADGRGKSLWAPRKEGQIIAMQRAYPHPLKPEDMQYIEAHATSTQVGDATELAALAGAFPSKLASGRKIPLGSVKANIGHSLETAGVAGLAKAALAMQHAVIPPVANLTKPNPIVDWDKLPFDLPTKAQPWERLDEQTPRRAAVNSFGIGGLNVHIVLEEYVPELGRSYYGLGDVKAKGGAAAQEPIAVIGTGSILPGAATVEAFWDLLQSGRDPKCDAPPDRWDAALFYDPTGKEAYRTCNKRGGFITDYHYDWRRHKVPPKQIANANPLQFMLLDATEEALKQAGYLDKDFDRDRVGVIIGSIFGGDFSNELQAGLRLPEFGRTLRALLRGKGTDEARIDEAVKEYEEVLLKNMPALLDETGSFTSSTLASRITKTFDLKGGALALDAGNGSGLAALGACINVLRRGVCDMMICATGQRNMDITVFESLTRFGYLAPGEAYPAFDARSEGYVPGEGCGAMLLKRLSDAQRDGDPILAVLHGVGASTDWKQPGAAMRQALERALAVADASPRDLRGIEALGMRPALAETEIKAIADVLATDNVEQPVVVNSLVSQFGFMGAAHAMAAAIKGVLAVSRQELPAGLVTDNPAKGLPFSPQVQLSQQTVAMSSDSASAVGVACGNELGTCYHAVIENVDRAVARRKSAEKAVPAAAAAAGPLHIVRVAASDWDTLRQRLQSGRVAELYQPDRRFTAADCARVAIVCTGASDFAAKCQVASERIDDRGRKTRDKLAAEGIYFGEPQPFSSGCAFVFPGQGSQYAGMLSKLREEIPATQAACLRADAALAALGYESFEQIAGRGAQDLGKDVWKTQVSILLADFIMDDTFRQLGVRPSVVAGHSFGEYPALVSAGAWGLTDAIRCTRNRYQSIVDTPDAEGCLAATTAPLEEVKRILAEVGDGVYLANLNAPDQTVIGGRRDAVGLAVTQLKKQRHTAVVIKVPCPFHTPLMAETARMFAHRLPEISLRDSQFPVVSTASSEVMTRADQFAASLVSQLSTPVDYVQVLRAVLDRRPALVVEVGPQQVLTRLNKKIHTGEDVVFMASDVPRWTGAASLLGVMAQADCLGCLELGQRRRAGDHEKVAATPGRILVFDATERRTMKKRLQAKGVAPKPRKAPAKTKPTEAVRLATDSPRAATRSAPAPATPAPAPVSQAPVVPQPLAAPPTAGADKSAVADVGGGAPDRKELQEILVGFVVEQTGYPEDIVELDADLEADLGIDSIKKAQLFGEVGEKFKIAPREDLSLDDFPTLTHVLDFLVEELDSRAAANMPSADEPAPVAPVSPAPAPAPQTPVAVATAPSSPAAITAPAATTAPAAPAAPSAAPTAAAGSSSAVDEKELREILVGFVVEQTGYPEDIIEMDADLEADLGIDSIKKAQLFGEVGEKFQIAPREDLSLDDFPTLGHVIAFLVEELGGRDSAPTAAAVESPALQPSAAVAEVPAEPADAPAPSAVPAEPTAPASPADGAGDAVSVDELREILVGFVVDQTGYPEDIIEMDADLEADLGIDSIKKAQLFGEVGERFQIAPREDLSLDDFPTLTHVIDFLVEELGSRSDGESSPAESPAESQPTSPSVPAPVATTAVSVDADEIQHALISLVVEQTGFPESLIQLDATLEGDLGFVGKKKTRFLEKVTDRFGRTPCAGASVAAPATLREVLACVVEQLESPSGVEPPAAPATATEPATKSAAPVVSDQPSAAPVVAPATTAPSPAGTPAVDADQLREILVSFVVDQTGYPEDIIEMDADLEADLGIDSIKKAQLFGEVGERFQIAPREDLSLDDFPTLDHVIAFLVEELGLRESVGSAPAAPAVESEPAEVAQPVAADQPSPSREAAPVTVAGVAEPLEDFVQLHVLEGSPDDFGWQHGHALRRAIHRELAMLVDYPGNGNGNGNGNGASSWPNPWAEELSGLARGAEVNQEALSIWNQRAEPLASLRTAFGSEVTGVLLPLQRDSVTLVQVRKPNDGMAYLTIGKPGRLWAPAGINAARVAVSAEPLESHVPAADVVTVTKRLHQLLAKSQTVAEAQSQLEQLLVTSTWSFGVSLPGQSQQAYLVSEGGQVRQDATAVSPEQSAFHQSLDNDPSTLVLTDRRSGIGTSICIAEVLPAAAPSASPIESPLLEDQPPAVMGRHVMRMTPAPRPAGGMAYGQGDLVCVVGASPIAPELRNQLEQSGCRLADVTGPDWVASFGQSLTSEVPKHLLLLNESQVEAAPLDDSSLAEQFAGPFEICRGWVAALEAADAMAGATLVAVTRMGGDFGFQASGGNFAGGGLTGLLKGVRREYPALRVKVLDFDWAAEPATIARELSAEVGSQAPALEVGFKVGTRYVVQAVPQVVPHDSRSELKRGGVWVVSGGGRGVTSVVARQLGRQFGLKLHLLGTAPLPEADGSWRGLDEDQLKQLKRDTALRARREGKSPADEWRRVEKAIEMDRNLSQFAADGVPATYHQCDIRDRDSLATVLTAVRQADGPIDGILHGAGIEAACRFVRKKPESVAATIASKCDGAAHLISLTQQDPLQCFVGFGSTSGRFGGLGQADYSLASDLLAKMMGPLQAAHPNCAAVCFHWPAWGEVGMAVRPESKMALEHGGISFMPTREGVAHLVAELQSGTGEREILLLDKPEPLDTDGTMSRTSAPADPETFRAVEPREGGQAASGAVNQPSPAPVADSAAKSIVDCSRMPLIRAIRTDATAENVLAEVPLEATTDPFLVHHQFRGGPFLPAVLSLEMFAEAAAAWKAPALVTGFRDIELKNGWTVDPARNHEALVRMTSEDGGVRCELIGPFYNSQGELVEKDRVYVSGLVELGESTPQVDPIEPGKPVYDWFPFIYPEGMDIHHGSPFRTLQKVDFQHGGGRAIIAGRPRNEMIGDRPGDGMLVSAAALDGCMVTCGAYGYAMLERSIALPLGMEHYQQVRLPRDGEKCIARFFLRNTSRENSVFDIMLLGEEGDVIFDAKGYRTANVRENA